MTDYEITGNKYPKRQIRRAPSGDALSFGSYIAEKAKPRDLAALPTPSEVPAPREAREKTALILFSGRRMPVTVPARGWDNHTGTAADTFILLMPDDAPPGGAGAVPRGEFPAITEHLFTPDVIFLPGETAPPEPWSRRLARRVFIPRAFAAALLTLLLLAPLLALCRFGSFSYLADEGAPHLPRQAIWTSVSDPRGIANQVTRLHEADVVKTESFGSTNMLTVVRAYPVTLTADGATETVKVLGATAGELLEQQGVALGEDDIVSHELQTVLREGENVVVRRVTYETRSAAETVAYESIRRMSPLLRADSEYVAREGENGSVRRVYREQYIDGAFAGDEIIAEIILANPVDEIVTAGDPSASASFLDGKDFTDVEIVGGVPAEYERVMDDAICTAYSYPAPVFGASGMSLIQGFVAVDPAVIPYGTLLYIASEQFTYGWAVAADCGTAMLEGYVDIDCFFETYPDSAAFGKKLLDVYIIRQLTQSELEEYAANGMFYDRVPG